MCIDPSGHMELGLISEYPSVEKMFTCISIRTSRLQVPSKMHNPSGAEPANTGCMEMLEVLMHDVLTGSIRHICFP
jgi:hypothetical protein